MIAAEFQHFGVDEALDKTKRVRVGSALDLAEIPLFVFGQKGQILHLGKSVRQVLLFLSKVLFRMTSLSMSHRTRFDAATARA